MSEPGSLPTARHERFENLREYENRFHAPIPAALSVIRNRYGELWESSAPVRAGPPAGL